MKRSALALGLVLAGLLVGSVRAAAQPTARLRGVVYDSVSRAPLANAAIRVFRSDNAGEGVDARTDSTGAFSVSGLRAGTWLLSFLHPRLDSLRLEPPLARVDVVEAGDIDVTLAVPSGASLARALCGATLDDSTAVVVGDVRDAAARWPLVGATVRVTWPEWVFAKKAMAREDVARVSRTDSTGQFVLCRVPQGTTVTALAYAGADTTGVIELTVPTADYVVADFVIDRTVGGLVSPVAGASGATGKRGRGAVRGVVTTPDGKPFPNAVARVLGSGSSVRSDSAGVFRVIDAVAGTQTVEIRAVGFEPQRRSVVLRPDDALDLAFTITKSSVLLDTIRVIAGRKLPPEVVRLEQRWRRGFGVFMDATTIRERTSTRITSALWGIPGVRLGTRSGAGNSVWMRGVGGGECAAPVFLDGFPLDMGDISIDELVSPLEVVAVEVYARSENVPAEFMNPFNSCGVLLVWTRLGVGNVPVIDPRRSRR